MIDQAHYDSATALALPPQSGRRVRSANETVAMAVVGCGYWGPNLIRNFSAAPGCRVARVCDADKARLEKARALCPGAEPTANFEDVLADPAIDALAIATPVRTHAPLAKAALEAGKHVLIEKPLALSSAEGEALVRLADERGLTLMVDHTFLYSPAVNKIRELVAAGELGELYFIDSVRINLGLFQNDVNVLWDLAPHDLSIVDYLLGREPRSLSAIGASHTASEQEDVAYLNLDFGSGLIATFHVNWMSPTKIRHLIVGGSRKSLVYNQLDPAEPIKVYDRGFEVQDAESRRGALVSYRLGDVWSPHLPQTEPLSAMAQHFLECVRSGQTPRSDGRAGVRVVRVLEAAGRSIRAQGGRITL